MENTKTVRQLEVVNKWVSNDHKGTLIATTGFGKTYTAILAAEQIKPVSMIVVVPTLILKDQWLKELDKSKLENYQVYVINTASKTQLNCELLVLDECHTVPAVTFSEVFNTIKYEKIFCLTATIERADGNHDLIVSKAPIIDTITLDECLANGWISPYTIYNLEVPFTATEQLAYNKANNNFKFFAMKMGYGDTFGAAKNFLVNGTPEQKGWAGGYFNSMRARKACITNNTNKANITVDIINRFPNLYSIVFSESIKFADEINALIPDISVSIHSKMTAKKQREAMDVFKDGRTKKRVIASCKALSAGLDLPQLSLGIIASFNSSKLTSTQTVGRIVRKQEGKQAYIINLYTPDTQEMNWLNKKQFGVQNIKWIKSVKEII